MTENTRVRSYLKAALLVVHPGYDVGVVPRVVQEVPDEHIEGRQGQLGGVFPRSPPLAFTTRGGGRGGARTVWSFRGSRGGGATPLGLPRGGQAGSRYQWRRRRRSGRMVSREHAVARKRSF